MMKGLNFGFNKKGSHVGLILSFAIFVIFSIFLYSVLEPALKKREDKQRVLDYLEIELLERSSSELTSMSISIADSVTLNKDCIELGNGAETVKDNFDLNALIAKDNSETFLTYSVSGANFYLSNSNKNKFFKLYSSDEFSSSAGSLSQCDKVKDGEYTFGLTRTQKYIFKTKIIKLINDYEFFKSTLEISGEHEFGFGFLDDKRNVVKETEKEQVPVSVYVREVPIQFIDEQANINSGFVNIWVW